MTDILKLIPLSKAAEHFPEGAKPSHATLHRWGRRYPGLTIRIGGRDFMTPATAKALGRGTPLAEAAALGAGRDRAA